MQIDDAELDLPIINHPPWRDHSMVKKKNPTRRQHFVPQWHLRNFAKDGLVRVLDKPTGRVFAASPAKVGAKNDFYTLPFDGPNEEPLTERVLGVAEQECATAVKKVLGKIEYYVTRFQSLQQALFDGQTYSVLTPRQQGVLAFHVMLQAARTPARRIAIAQAQRALLERTKEMYRHRDDIDFADIDPDADPLDEATRHGASLFSDAMVEAVDTVANWSFVFHYNRSSQPLYTSDQPVVQQDLTELEPGSLPFPVEGMPASSNPTRFVSKTAFYWPMSSRVLLVVLGGPDGGHVPGINGRVLDMPDPTESNSMQTYFSHRQVFCAVDEFECAQSVLAEYPRAADPNRKLVGLQSMNDYFTEARARTERHRLRHG